MMEEYAGEGDDSQRAAVKKLVVSLRKRNVEERKIIQRLQSR